MIAALLSLLLAAPVGRTPVLLDTDIGTDIDDAWALAYTLTRDDFDLTAVTITDGDTPARARVAAKVLFLTGRKDVPVAVGRRTPVPPDRIDFQFQWAEDFTASSPTATPAADEIVAQARKHPGELVLMAVGPLQNVADALRKEPRLPQLVKRLVLMSGCVYGSKWGLVAEWNVKQAVDDARLVYAASFPLTIVPLDSTSKVVLAQAERERLRKHQSPLTTAIEALVPPLAGEARPADDPPRPARHRRGGPPRRVLRPDRDPAPGRGRKGLHPCGSQARKAGAGGARAEARRLHGALPGPAHRTGPDGARRARALKLP